MGEADSLGVKYDAWGRAVQTTEDDGLGPTGTVTYAYDAMGRQIYASIGGSGSATQSYYSGNNVIEERDGSGTVISQYVWSGAGNQLVLRDQPAATITRMYALTDAAGSTTSIVGYAEIGSETSSSWQVVERHLYDVNGDPTAVKYDWSSYTSFLIPVSYTHYGWDILYHQMRDHRYFPAVPSISPTIAPSSGGSDVVGNWVNEQFQLDAFGEALLLFPPLPNTTTWTRTAGEPRRSPSAAIEARWREKDAGIWELEPDEWTHSRLICASRAAGDQQLRARRRASGTLARLGRRDHRPYLCACSLHPSGRWQRSPDDDRLDTALLLPAIRGAIPHHDPRSLATLRAIHDELTQDGYAYRYRPDGRPLGEAEGAFLLCGFLVSLAYTQQGDADAAARWFERNRTACGPPGLLSEEFDVTERQLRGNLPQAFVHALLLECAASQQQPASGG